MNWGTVQLFIMVYNILNYKGIICSLKVRQNSAVKNFSDGSLKMIDLQSFL